MRIKPSFCVLANFKLNARCLDYYEVLVNMRKFQCSKKVSKKFIPSWVKLVVIYGGENSRNKSFGPKNVPTLQILGILWP